MKTITLLMMLCLFVVTTGCEDTLPESHQHNEEAMFEGTWMLKRVSGGMAGVDHDIPDGMVMWTFNTQTQRVTVQNSNTDITIPAGLDSGTYDYGFMDSNAPLECNTTLLIDDADYGCYIFTDNGLRISHDYADGFVYDFVEVE